MRRLFFMLSFIAMESTAHATDLGFPYNYIPTIGPAYDWSGFYAGVHAGYASGDASVRDTNGGVAPGPFGYSPSGGFGGIQGGYNWQIQRFIIGFEGDLGYMGTSGKGVIGSASAVAHQDLTLGGGLYGDLTARAGVTVGPALFYAKGGWAYFDTSAKQQTTNPGYTATGTGAFNGWVAGAGAEYMLMPNVSAKIEYLHYDLGSQGGYQTNVGDLSSPAGYRFLNSTNLKFDTVKVGASYHF